MVTISPSGSMSGFTFAEWVKRNKDTIKMLIMATAGLSTFAATMYLPLWANAGLTLIVTTLAKLGCDMIDFKYSDVVLPEKTP